jgi:hypothetical protein
MGIERNRWLIWRKINHPFWHWIARYQVEELDEADDKEDSEEEEEGEEGQKEDTEMLFDQKKVESENNDEAEVEDNEEESKDCISTTTRYKDPTKRTPCTIFKPMPELWRDDVAHVPSHFPHDSILDLNSSMIWNLQ